MTPVYGNTLRGIISAVIGSILENTAPKDHRERQVHFLRKRRGQVELTEEGNEGD